MPQAIRWFGKIKRSMICFLWMVVQFDKNVRFGSHAVPSQMSYRYWISSVLIFVLYRYISTALGVDRLGVWSVVLAAASASRLADLGLNSGGHSFCSSRPSAGFAAESCAGSRDGFTNISCTRGAAFDRCVSHTRQIASIPL